MRRWLIDGGKVLVAATLVAQVRLGRHRLSSQRARVPEDFGFDFGFKIARERASAKNGRRAGAQQTLEFLAIARAE